MNRKIYYKDKFIAFTDGQIQTSGNQALKKITNEPQENELKEILRDFLDEKSLLSYSLASEHFEKSFLFFKNKLHYIEAAGGLIEKDSRFLCIHRLGRWDLPKGKLEKGETIEEAAVRECEEECGIKKLTIVHPLSSTFHIYPYKGNFAIKQSYWFYMSSTYDKPLVAQTEENIDEVRWFTREEILQTVIKDTYYTISDVLREAIPGF